MAGRPGFRQSPPPGPWVRDGSTRAAARSCGTSCPPTRRSSRSGCGKAVLATIARRCATVPVGSPTSSSSPRRLAPLSVQACPVRVPAGRRRGGTAGQSRRGGAAGQDDAARTPPARSAGAPVNVRTRMSQGSTTSARAGRQGTGSGYGSSRRRTLASACHWVCGSGGYLKFLTCQPAPDGPDAAQGVRAPPVRAAGPPA